MNRLPEYTIFYKIPSAIFWHSIKHVVEDGFIDGTPIRFCVNTTGERIELPSSNLLIRFSPDRAKAIEEINRKNRESASLGGPGLVR